MKAEKKLDKILTILYDENLLHWKEIPATTFIAFAKNKFNIDWSDAEINLILTILQNDGYVVLNKKDINQMKTPSFSLTAKGVQMKLNGGFVRQKIKTNITDFTILWAAIFTIIISFYTLFNYIGNNGTENKINDDNYILYRRPNRLSYDFKNGKSTINGYAEDYATVIQAFISLHEITLDEKWLILSKEIMEYTIIHFYDSTSGMFFYTSKDDPNLIARKTEVIDGVISSSNSIPSWPRIS